MEKFKIPDTGDIFLATNDDSQKWVRLYNSKFQQKAYLDEQKFKFLKEKKEKDNMRIKDMLGRLDGVLSLDANLYEGEDKEWVSGILGQAKQFATELFNGLVEGKNNDYYMSESVGFLNSFNKNVLQNKKFSDILTTHTSTRGSYMNLLKELGDDKKYTRDGLLDIEDEAAILQQALKNRTITTDEFMKRMFMLKRESQTYFTLDDYVKNIQAIQPSEHEEINGAYISKYSAVEKNKILSELHSAVNYIGGSLNNIVHYVKRNNKGEVIDMKYKEDYDKLNDKDKAGFSLDIMDSTTQCRAHDKKCLKIIGTLRPLFKGNITNIRADQVELQRRQHEFEWKKMEAEHDFKKEEKAVDAGITALKMQIGGIQEEAKLALQSGDYQTYTNKQNELQPLLAQLQNPYQVNFTQEEKFIGLVPDSNKIFDNFTQDVDFPVTIGTNMARNHFANIFVEAIGGRIELKKEKDINSQETQDRIANKLYDQIHNMVVNKKININKDDFEKNAEGIRSQIALAVKNRIYQYNKETDPSLKQLNGTFTLEHILNDITKNINKKITKVATIGASDASYINAELNNKGLYKGEYSILQNSTQQIAKMKRQWADEYNKVATQNEGNAYTYTSTNVSAVAAAQEVFLKRISENPAGLINAINMDAHKQGDKLDISDISKSGLKLLSYGYVKGKLALKVSYLDNGDEKGKNKKIVVKTFLYNAKDWDQFANELNQKVKSHNTQAWKQSSQTHFIIDNPNIASDGSGISSELLMIKQGHDKMNTGVKAGKIGYDYTGNNGVYHIEYEIGKDGKMQPIAKITYYNKDFIDEKTAKENGVKQSVYNNYLKHSSKFSTIYVNVNNSNFNKELIKSLNTNRINSISLLKK